MVLLHSRSHIGRIVQGKIVPVGIAKDEVLEVTLGDRETAGRAGRSYSAPQRLASGLEAGEQRLARAAVSRPLINCKHGLDLLWDVRQPVPWPLCTAERTDLTGRAGGRR